MNFLARLVLILAVLAPSHAVSETLRGLVVGVNGVAVEIMVEGQLLPVPGDRATITSESLDGDLTTVGVWRIDRLEGDRIHASPEGSVGEVWPGQVVEIDSPAPQEGRRVADPWLESLLAEAEAIGPPVPVSDIGEPTEVVEPSREPDVIADADKPIDPNTLDPGKESESRLIREWIAVARPPESAVEGNNVHYSGKGNVVGTVRGGVIESRHETGVIDPVYLWTNKRQLDSIDHCTMEEYVVAKLEQKAIGHCAGRYGAVKDLRGIRLAEAKAAVTGAGFGYSLAPGSPARMPEQEGTIERQEPGSDKYLRKGQVLKFTVHSPYVPPGVILPDFTGRSVAESRNWLQASKLKVSLRAGSPALTPATPETIEKQEPAPGTKVEAGSTVNLTVHSKYVDIRKVPGVVGLSAEEAKRRIAGAGLKTVMQPGGRPSLREQAGIVERQNPESGNSVLAGSGVSLYVYGPFIETVVVPDIRGLSYDDAKRKLEAAGLSIGQRDAGKPSQRNLANVAQKQDPPAGTQVSKGQIVLVWFYGQYIPSQEEQVAATDCSRLPGSRAYWDNNAGKPLCGCFDGLQWNLTNTRCVTADVRENELCAREGQGLIAQGRTVQGKINCVCPEGLTWNASQKACEKLIPPEELCSRNYPGSVPTGRDDAGRVNCDCPQGFVWNSTRTGCEKQLSPQELCARHFPGSVPTGRDATGKVNCDCPQGYVWADNPRRCIEGRGGGDRDWRGWDRNQQCEYKISTIRNFMALYRMNPQNTLQKQMAENIAREASALGCDHNQINQALGAGGGIERQDTGDACPCIDEQGKRYREAFGQACGTGGSALRDYNCSGRETTGGGTSQQQRAPASCSAPGMTIIHKLIDPPPYTGVTPICRDGSGRLWLQDQNRMESIRNLIKGKQNRQTGCYDGSKVIIPSRTLDGRLCGP